MIMKPFLSLFLSLFLLLLLQNSSIAAAAGHHNIISNTCKECSLRDPNLNYTLCINLFNSIPKSRHANLTGLAIIATKAAAANGTNIQSIVKKLLKSYPPNSNIESCLDTCLDLYSDATGRLNDSCNAVKSKRYDDANIWISAALDTPGTCEDQFEEGGVKSPLTEENDEFSGIATIALGIVAMLQGSL